MISFERKVSPITINAPFPPSPVSQPPLVLAAPGLFLENKHGVISLMITMRRKLVRSWASKERNFGKKQLAFVNKSSINNLDWVDEEEVRTVNTQVKNYNRRPFNVNFNKTNQATTLATKDYVVDKYCKEATHPSPNPKYQSIEIISFVPEGYNIVEKFVKIKSNATLLHLARTSEKIKNIKKFLEKQTRQKKKPPL